jgi:hypothetical protein
MAVHVEFHVEKLTPCSLRPPLRHLWCRTAGYGCCGNFVGHGGVRNYVFCLQKAADFAPSKIGSSFGSGGRLQCVGTLAHVKDEVLNVMAWFKDYRFLPERFIYLHDI